MENEKAKFYIFLDIDGTLWDSNTPRYAGFYIQLKPESVVALNTLIESLKKIYDVDLVVTSKRRIRWSSCRQFLIDNGVNFPSEKMNRTQVVKLNNPRGVKIAEYLFNDVFRNRLKNEKTFSKINRVVLATFINRKFSDYYVVLDDSIKPLKPYVPEKNIIRTSYYESLSMEMVSDFLESKNIPIVENRMTNVPTSKMIEKDKLKN